MIYRQAGYLQESRWSRMWHAGRMAGAAANKAYRR
jgi:hypothetical protein